MTGIVWWEIETPEPETFQRFHAALSGWSFEPAFADTELGADYWIIQQDGRGIGGLQRAAPTAPPPSAGPRVYLAVEDLETALERVVELGGVVERSRIALGGDDRWFGVFRDPTGVSFGLWTEYPERGLAQQAASEFGAVTDSGIHTAIYRDRHRTSRLVRHQGCTTPPVGRHARQPTLGRRCRVAVNEIVIRPTDQP